MKLRHTMMAAAILAAAPAFAAAQSLAVPQHVPADAVAVVSINDTNTMWGNLAKSPLVGPVKELFALPALQEGMGELAGALAEAEAELGFPVNADTMLGDKVTGVDVYMLPTSDGATVPSIVKVLKFKSADDAEAIAELVVAELGDGATDATTAEVGGATVHSFPTSEFHIAVNGDLIVAGTTAEAVGAAITSDGKAAILESPEFARAMGQLAERPHQMWVYGAGDQLVDALGAVVPPDAASGLNSMKGQTIAMVGDFQSDFVKLTSFTPKENFTGAQQVSAANASSNDLKAAAYLPGNSLLSFTMNYLSAKEHWDATIADAQKAGPEAQMGLGMIQGSLQGSEQSLGFSVFDELFPALGSNMGVSINKLAFNPTIQPPIDVDLTLAAQAKDAAKLQEILGKLEASVNAALKEQLMATGMAPGDDFSAFIGKESSGQKLRVFKAPEGFDAQVPVTPAYTLTDDGFLVFGLSEKGVTDALARATGGGETATTSASFQRAQQLFDTNRNSVTAVNLSAISDTGTNLMLVFGATQPPDAQAAINSTLKVLKAMGSVYAVKTYSDAGSIDEFVTVMK
ncbi:MAG: hypothetical protein SF028_13800 [Candidatus Sumerlaeia bacterium]|nr:hypothetical protein [Candidatus Sumerlaeia bacterium]